MSQIFFFVLGRNPDLSILELFSYFHSQNLDYLILDKKPFKLNEKYGLILILQLYSYFNPIHATKTLAGTIKIGRIFIECDEKSVELKLEQENFYLEDHKNIKYALNFYGKNINFDFFFYFFKNTYKMMKQKAYFKKIPPHSLARSIKFGQFVDVIVFKSENTKRFFIGRTASVYDINDEKKRYEGRPFIDKSIGLSPRMARILVNFAELKPNSGFQLLDPFSGTGTILQEAMLMGFNVQGLEIDANRVKKSRNNLIWLRNTYPINKDCSFTVTLGDSRKLTNYFSTGFEVDCIVTEPELGPFLKKRPDPNIARKIISDLVGIYKPFFKEASKILKIGGKLIIILPRIITSSKTTEEINVKQLLSNSNLKIFNPMDRFAEGIKKEDLPNRFPVIYKEKWHLIDRIIYFIEKG